MFSPVRRTKKNDAILHNLDQLIREGVSRIGLKPSQFKLIYDDIRDDIKFNYTKEIPYHGAIIYILEVR